MSKRKYGNEKSIQKIMSPEGRLQDKTIQRRKAILNNFKKYVLGNEIVFEDLLERNEDGKKNLEKAMVKYFSDLMIKDKKTKEPSIPKAKTMEFYVSNLKSALSEITPYDFGDKKGM